MISYLFLGHFCSSHPGGGSGIGRAVCQRFASEGASVVVADISEESANETLGSLQSDLRGQGHMAAVVDVSSKESITSLVTCIQVCVTDTNTHCVSIKVTTFSEIYTRYTAVFVFSFISLFPSFYSGNNGRFPPPLQTRYFQPPSVCVNAAGITQDDFLLNMEEEHFDRVVRVNLKVAAVTPCLNPLTH